MKLEVAGRLLYFDIESRCFIMGLHSTSPEKAHKATELAWDSIPDGIKAKLQEANIGFAGRQI